MAADRRNSRSRFSVADVVAEHQNDSDRGYDDLYSDSETKTRVRVRARVRVQYKLHENIMVEITEKN